MVEEVGTVDLASKSKKENEKKKRKKKIRVQMKEGERGGGRRQSPKSIPLAPALTKVDLTVSREEKTISCIKKLTAALTRKLERCTQLRRSQTFGREEVK